MTLLTPPTKMRTVQTNRRRTPRYPPKYRLSSYSSLVKLEQYKPLRNWWQLLQDDAELEAVTHPVVIEPWPSDPEIMESVSG